MAAWPSTARQGRWRALTWAIFLATGAALLATIVLWANNDFAVPPVTFYRSTWIVVVQWLILVGPGAMGLLLGLRLPGSRVALALAGVGLVIGLQNVADMLVANPVFAATSAGAAVAWLASTFTFAGGVFLAIFNALIFPNDRPVTPAWGRTLWLAGAGCLLLVLYQGFVPGNLTWYRDFPNPLQPPAWAVGWLLGARYAGLGCIALALVLAGWSQVIRYRGSDLVGRQQLKWFVYGMGVLVVTALIEMTAFITLPPDSALGELSLAGIFLGGALVPVATAVGILRYGLYEIDVLIGRTVVFGALTAVLAGLYAAGIRLFQSLFVAVTGQESDAALVLTTLVLATTFTPIKQRLEGIVARRYQGHPASGPAAVGPPHGASAALAPGDPATQAALRALVADLVREELARSRPAAEVQAEGEER